MALSNSININMQEAKDLSDAFSESMIDPLINAIMAKPPNENKWLTRIRSVILNEIAPNDLRSRIRLGLERVAFDLLANLGKNEVYQILQQWKQGMKKLTNKSPLVSNGSKFVMNIFEM